MKTPIFPLLEVLKKAIRNRKGRKHLISSNCLQLCHNCQSILVSIHSSIQHLMFWQALVSGYWSLQMIHIPLSITLLFRTLLTECSFESSQKSLSSRTGSCYISITLQKEPHAEELGYVRYIISALKAKNSAALLQCYLQACRYGTEILGHESEIILQKPD